MKLKDALICDVRTKGVWDELHELLFKVPPLKKYGPNGPIPLEKLEKLMWVFNEKYGIQLQYIMTVPQKGMDGFYYSCSLKTNHNNTWIGTVYGITIYECFVKMVLLSYGYIKSKQN